jgi:starch phosphorylase
MEDRPLGDLLGRKIVYLSREIGINSNIPTYANGLRVLAGYTSRSSADLNRPMIGITLVSRGGYFKQETDSAGRQMKNKDP